MGLAARLSSVEYLSLCSLRAGSPGKFLSSFPRWCLWKGESLVQFTMLQLG